MTIAGLSGDPITIFVSNKHFFHSIAEGSAPQGLHSVGG